MPVEHELTSRIMDVRVGGAVGWCSETTVNRLIVTRGRLFTLQGKLRVRDRARSDVPTAGKYDTITRTKHSSTDELTGEEVKGLNMSNLVEIM